MAKVSIDNTQLSNGRLSETNIICLGKDIATGIVSAYVLGISTLSNLSGITKRLKNASSTENLVRDSRGSIIADLAGEEELGSSEITLEYKVDWNSRIEGQRYGMASNIYEAFLTGSTFKHAGNDILCVSVLGVKKSGKRATKCELNREYGDYFKIEYSKLWTGGVDSTGNPVFETNNLLDKITLENHAFAVENYTLLGNGKSESLLFPALATNNPEFSQADDGDMYSVPCVKKTDTFVGDNALTMGARMEYAIDSENKPYFAVDYIVLATSAPTDFGNADDLICLVDPTTKAFTIQKSSGSAWSVQSTGSFAQYGKIFAPKLSTSTIALSTSQVCYVTAHTADASNGGVATDYNDGTGVYPVLKFFTLDRTAEDFIALTSEEIC